MTEISPTPRPTFWRAISDRNPFYLLSAACMLFGCTALANSSSWSPIKLNRLLILTATLNFYEFLLIGLGIFLIARRGLRRDGTILLILETFFLVDVTFLNSEIFATNLRIGSLVNVILFLLAIAKISLIFRGLGISLTGGAFFSAMIEMFVLFALPGVFKRLSLSHNGTLSALTIYATWWVIGALPMIAALLTRDRFALREPQRSAFRQSRRIVGTLLVLPVLSLIAHASTSNWIYSVPWCYANLSPLMLGLAVAIGACDMRVRTFGLRTKAHFFLPIAAMILAMQFPASLVFHVHFLWFSPLRCALIGAMLVYAAGFLLHRHVLFAWAACVCFGVAGVGMSIREIMENLNAGARQTVGFSRRLWPQTMMQWGVVSVVASFVWLILGALVSLRKPLSVEVIEDQR
jgi:hypothetical protein